MITKIWINGGCKEGDNMPVLRPYDPDHTVSIAVNFWDEESRDAFVKSFPKSMRVRSGYISEYNFDTSDYACIHIEKPYASIQRMRENKVTGELNEIGLKRMQRFYDALAAQFKIDYLQK